MDKFVGLMFAITLYFLPGCKGLQLTLDRKFSSSSTHHATCGVLLCLEEVKVSINGTFLQMDQENGFPPTPIANISSLKIFRVEPRVIEGEKRYDNLATITTQLWRLAIVADGIKVDGLMAAGRATLRLQLSNQEDCRSEFVCQSHGADAEGREVLSTSFLTQPPHQQTPQPLSYGYNLPWAASSVGHLLTSINNLDSKLAVMSSAIASWENKMIRFQDKVEQEINSLKSNVDEKSDRLEDKLEGLGKDLSSHVNRLDDKLESLHRKAEYRANRFEDKLESSKTRLEDKLNSVGISKPDGLVSYINDLKENVENFTRAVIESFGKEFSFVKGDLQDLKIDIHHELYGLNGEIDLTLRNLTELLKGELAKPENKQALLTELTQNLKTFERNLEIQVQGLLNNITITGSDTYANVSEQGTDCNLTIDRNIKISLNELLTPTNCFKGMASTVASLTSSMYVNIQPNQANGLAASVLCDTFTDGGGWVVFQRRVNGDVNFYRGWDDYKNGFGNLQGDFWLGNDIIHAMTSEGEHELRIDMRYNGHSVFAHYDSFSLGDERSNFGLHVAHYSGDAGDSLLSHNGMAFSTHDRDNDIYTKNCAIEFVGAWWYGACHASNLNGQWNAGGNKGPRWNTLSAAEPVTYTEMKLRRVI